ncbi:MAG: tRNA (guanosine(46)-N(7))-methyltransferase TrmB [Kordiimonas sp.]
MKQVLHVWTIGKRSMQADSRRIESNQLGPHERLKETVIKHIEKPFRKPIAEHTQKVFDLIQRQIARVDRPIVFDSCCGVGDSSRTLAKEFPDHWVIGIDKSENRLSRERAGSDPDNLILARADLNDFYRLAHKAGWQFDRHYILYPNPWPKSEHLGRRWHGAPVFPYIVKLGGVLELRSNWKLYLEEFAAALQLLGQVADLKSFTPETFMTPFEKKYYESGQTLWRLTSGVSQVEP